MANVKIADLKRINRDDIDYMKIYTNKYDSMNNSDNYKTGLKQYWGDDEKVLEVNFDTGLVEETQDNGEKVGMGYLSQDNIAALKKNYSDYDDKGFKKNNNVDESLRYEKNNNSDYDDRGFKKNNNVDESLKYEKNNNSDYDDRGFKKNKDVDGSLRYENNKSTNNPTSTTPKSTTGASQPVEKSVGSTVLNGITSLGEGVMRTAQNLVNATVITGNNLTKINPIVAIANYTNDGKIYEKMDKQTQLFVESGWVDDYYDDFWAKEGSDIKKKSYASDAVATGGKIVGKVLFNGLLMYAGGSIAGAAGGGAGAASSAGTAVATTGEVGTAVATTGTETAVALASNAGASAATAAATTGATSAATSASSGISRIILSSLFGAEAKGATTAKAWKNGADYNRGNLAGDVSGLVEGGIVYAGASLNELGAANLLNSAGKEAAANYIAANGLDRVVTALGTGTLGAAHALTNPISSAIGNETSYKEEFEKAGGAGSVAGSFVTATLLSFLTNGKNNSKVQKESINTSNQNSTSPGGYIEDKGVGNSATADSSSQTISKITQKESVTNETTSASNGATSSASSNSASTTASAATTTSIPDVDPTFIKNVSIKVNKPGGGANLSTSERDELARIIGVDKSQLINMDKHTYRELCKKYHTDNAGDAQIFNELFNIVNNLFHN